MSDMTAEERADNLILFWTDHYESIEELVCPVDMEVHIANQIRQAEAAARLRALGEAIRAIEAAYLDPGRLSDTFRAGKMACRYEVYALKEESDD